MRWHAWIVTTQQDDTPIPLVEAGSRQRNPRAWLTWGVEPPPYACEHGPAPVSSGELAIAWAAECGYIIAHDWSSAP
jgi:hypothetical protein